MRFFLVGLLGCGVLTGCRTASSHGPGERFVAASDPAMVYEGRWDRTDPEKPQASWPGFSVSTEFEGKAIHVRMNDAGNYYNVEVDGKFVKVVGGKRGSHLDYLLADGLSAGKHRIRVQRRNISFEKPTEIEGFIVDRRALLTVPPVSGKQRIEFIGDSYTAAEGNEAISSSLPWKEKYPVTNFAKGYAAVLGEMTGSDVTAVCRSGSGLVTNWEGQREHTMGERFGWTLMNEATPAWEFDEPSPNLTIISLGLNDFSGLKGSDGKVSSAGSREFRQAYQKLIGRVRHHHPESRIVALAPFNPWAREQISTVVAEEKASGRQDVFYAQFDNFPDGYVADGHPTVTTHRKMAEQIFSQLKALGLVSAAGGLAD
ncbi:MAG: GDSL-type esterase/lipase family protein [Verrucomicrobiota bacterium]